MSLTPHQCYQPLSHGKIILKETTITGLTCDLVAGVDHCSGHEFEGW